MRTLYSVLQVRLLFRYGGNIFCVAIICNRPFLAAAIETAVTCLAMVIKDLGPGSTLFLAASKVNASSVSEKA